MGEPAGTQGREQSMKAAGKDASHLHGSLSLSLTLSCSLTTPHPLQAANFSALTVGECYSRVKKHPVASGLTWFPTNGPSCDVWEAPALQPVPSLSGCPTAGAAGLLSAEPFLWKHPSGSA